MEFAANPLVLFVLMGTMAVLPFCVVALSSFVKIQVVLGLLRIGLGAQQIPSGFVGTTLAFLLSCSIMAPLLSEIQRNLAPQQKAFLELKSSDTKLLLKLINHAADSVTAPLETFLRKQSKLRERVFFASVWGEASESAGADDREAEVFGLGPILCLRPGVQSEEAKEMTFAFCRLHGENLLSLSSAFLLSELQSAFTFGLLLFLPFLIVDLVVSNLLVGMGMSMVSPSSISLPLKIFLFVSTDSWFHIARGLILSYR